MSISTASQTPSAGVSRFDPWSRSETEHDVLNPRAGHETSKSWTEEREDLLAYIGEQFIGVSGPVLTFLRANSDLAWSLIGAKSAVVNAFGPAAMVRLAIVRDIDDESSAQQLFAYVRSTLAPGEALEALDRFDQLWFLEHTGDLAGLLAFDLDF